MVGLMDPSLLYVPRTLVSLMIEVPWKNSIGAFMRTDFTHLGTSELDYSMSPEV